MPTIFDVDAASFQARVIDASHRVPVLVDFWAEWCAPCRALKPVLEKLATAFAGRFLLAKLDSDRNQEIAAAFGVRSIPCVKAFIDGKVVREFTGALPEPQVRAFIQAVLPSPAEPLRVAAREARARGEGDVACSLLEDAMALDPENVEVGLDLAELDIDAARFEDAGRRLDAVDAVPRGGERAAALRARLKVLLAAGDGDLSALAAQVAANPVDLDARLRLANALAAGGDYRRALDELIEIVRRDRKWQDEAGRRAMLDLFAVLATMPPHDELLREYRVRLARTLN